jgi:hypothetical protein
MVVSGRWPADDAARAAIDAARGDGFDLMLSKNTLKRGYIRPDRPADRKHLIELGVDPAEFLKSVHGALRPGGALLIYNISPALSPPDQPFVPHSDGRSPWSREEFEAAGFEVVAFEHDDTDKVLDYWAALGYDEGKSREAVRGNLNANYTLVRRLAQPPAAAEATSR